MLKINTHQKLIKKNIPEDKKAAEPIEDSV
jgi:hypothetical protein